MCIEYKSICNTSELLYLMPQGMAREGTGGWGRNEMVWGDVGGAAREGTGRIGGVKGQQHYYPYLFSDLVPVLVDPEGHDLHCQV